MSIIAKGSQTLLIWFLVAAVASLYYLWQTLKGKKIALRESPILRLIGEGVDRSVELGAPIIVGPGDSAYLSGAYAPMTIAGMNIMRYVLRLAVRRGVKPILHAPCQVDCLPLMDGIYREVCMTEGKPEAYDRANIHYFGTEWKAYMAGSLGDVAREKPGLLVVIGALVGAGSAPEAGQAKFQGAITIMGTPRWAVAQFTALYSEFPILGDDTYYLGAICAEDPVVASPIIGGDVVKLFSIAAIVILAILGLAGQPVLSWLAS